MNSLQRALSDLIAEMPALVLKRVVSERLKQEGTSISEPALKKLVAHSMRADESSDTSPIPATRRGTKPTITITPEDLQETMRQLEAWQTSFPNLAEDVMSKASEGLLEALRKRWPGKAKLRKRYFSGFRKRLGKRWGTALEDLRMLIHIAHETGNLINKALRTTNTSIPPVLGDVLTRLQARACQVTEEIVCLLEGGYADGAMARWRTLQEISAVATLLLKHGEDLATRYVDHQTVESRKGALQYQKAHQRLQQEPIDPKELAIIEAQYDAVIARYGREFASQQGWAAHHLRIANPTIAQIQEAAGIDHLAPYYKMASHNVHANPKGVFCTLGMLGGNDVLLAGPSNAGLADPGHASAISLLQITSTLIQLDANLDNVVALKVMQQLVDEIGEDFIRAHKQLEQDHKR